LDIQFTIRIEERGIRLIERIDTICLRVSNLEEASKWYQETLDLQESYKGDTYRILRIGSSDIPLTLEEGKPVSSEQQSYPIFFTKDIHSAYEKLKAKGVNVSKIQHDEPNHFFTFYDEDHNKLQLCHWE